MAEYDRELIAQMLDVCGHPKFTLDAYREQARLLREADSADAARVGTVRAGAKEDDTTRLDWLAMRGRSVRSLHGRNQTLVRWAACIPEDVADPRINLRAVIDQERGKGVQL